MRANPPLTGHAIPLPTIAHIHTNKKVQAQSEKVCPVVIEKVNLGNHLKSVYSSVVKNIL